MYDLMDQACAETLGVSVEEYVDKIEKIDFTVAEMIIKAIFSEDDNQIAEAKRVFNLIE